MPGARVGERRFRRVVTLLCVTGLLLPLTGGAAISSPRSQLEAVHDRLDGVRGDLEQLDGRRSVTIADLEESQARQAALDTRLQALTADLHTAQGALSTADATLGATTAELEGTQQHLVQTREDLAGARDTLAARARAAYMYGGSGGANTSMLFGVSDVSEFNRALSYAQRILGTDQDAITLVGNLEREVQAAAAELALVQQRHQAERQVAAVERDRVAGMVDEQRELHDAVAAEADRHATILAELDADRVTHVALVDSLEAESAQLEADLRRQAEEARRAEAARLAEQESRRVAAANAARASRSAAAPPPASAPAPAPAPQQATASGWHRPSDGRFTSGYGMRRHPIYGTGRMHTGVDFGSPTGAPIYAATGGTVVSAGWRGGYGLAVVVDHGNGVATLYAHASRVDVSAGQQVGRGQIIARIGSTGQSTGPHLHFEVRVNGQHRDPMPYL